MENSRKRIRTIVAIGVFGAISTILYIIPIFNFVVPIAPVFMKIHLDEIPVFFAGLAYGPIASIGSLLIKTLIKLPFSFADGSNGVGELVDFIYSCAFILPTIFVFDKNKSFKNLIIGISIGTILQLVVSYFLNIFVMFPFYSFVYGISMEQIFDMCKAINANVVDTTWSLGLFIVLPFNAIKDAIVIAAVLIMFIPLKLFIISRK